MAVVTTVATAITVLKELNDLIGSQDPLFVHFNNHIKPTFLSNSV
jgi:hypothetical protein